MRAPRKATILRLIAGVTDWTLGRLDLSYWDSGRGGKPPPPPFLGSVVPPSPIAPAGTFSGLFHVPRPGGQVLTHYEAPDHPAGTTCTTDFPQYLPSGVAGETIVRGPAGTTLLEATTGTGDVLVLTNMAAATAQRTLAASATLAATDCTIWVNASSKTITLPAAASLSGHLYEIKNLTGITGTTVNVSGGGALETSGGATGTSNTTALSAAGAVARFRSDSRAWWLV